MGRSLALTIKAANATIMERGDLDAVGKFFSPKYVAHLTEDELTGGHTAIRKIVDTYRRVFPNLKVKVEILMQGTDRIAWQRTIRATHKGAFKGFPATGRRIVWRDMIVSRFRRDLIAEDWFITDLAEQLLRVRGRKR